MHSDGGTRCEQVAHSQYTGSRTRDLLIESQMPYPLRHYAVLEPYVYVCREAEKTLMSLTDAMT